VESDHCLLPSIIKHIKLLVLVFDDSLVELIAVCMFSGILGILVFDLLLHQLVHLRFQIESDINQFLAHATEV
jgi:hypothetical protein